MIAVLNAPRINPNDEEVALVGWHVADGDFVQKGDDLVDLETSKATVTIEAEAAGYVRLIAAVGSVVKVGAPLCQVAESAEENASAAAAAPVEAPAQQVASVVETPAEPTVAAKDPPPAAPSPPQTGDAPALTESATRFSKDAAALIAKLKLDPASFAGKGLVTARSILGEDAAPAAKPEKAAREPAIAVEIAGARSEAVLPSKRAEIDALSTGEAGGINSTLSVYFDSAPLRARLAAERLFDGNPQPIILYEIARLLLQWPRFTAFFADGQVHFFDRIDLGLALDMGKGLKVATIRHAATLSPQELFEWTIASGLKYQDNKLSADDLSGSTFTVTDLSGLDVLHFRPLVNGAQSAILGIGGDSMQPNHPMSLNLTFDHRVSNGREAALFLQELRARLVSFAPQPTSAAKDVHVATPTQPQHCARCGISQQQYQEQVGADAYMFAVSSPEGQIEAACHRCSGGFV